jgi:hypothetical protein
MKAKKLLARVRRTLFACQQALIDHGHDCKCATCATARPLYRELGLAEARLCRVAHDREEPYVFVSADRKDAILLRDKCGLDVRPLETGRPRSWLVSRDDLAKLNYAIEARKAAAAS